MTNKFTSSTCWKTLAECCALIPEAADIMSSANLIDCGSIDVNHPALAPKAVDLDPLLLNLPNLALYSQWWHSDGKLSDCLMLVSTKFDKKSINYHNKNALKNVHKLNIWLFDIENFGLPSMYGTAMQIILYINKNISTPDNESFPFLRDPSSFTLVNSLHFYRNQIVSESMIPTLLNVIKEFFSKSDANIVATKFTLLLVWLFDAWRINKVKETAPHKFVIT